MKNTEAWVLMDLLSLQNSLVAVPIYGDAAAKISETIFVRAVNSVSGAVHQMIYS